jgi:gluconate 2-dehydrogenase gamma chain
MSRVTRRAALRLIGLGGVAPVAAHAQPQAQVEARAEGRWSFFSEREAAFVRAAVDRLLPADGFPSASEAGVVDYIDRQLAGDFGRGTRLYMDGPHDRGTPQQGYQLPFVPARVYRAAIGGLAPHLGDRPFEQRTPQEQDDLLEQLERGDMMLGPIPSAVFFETLLANTIEGYFADPAYGGNRDMAGWRMVGFPGAYAQFVQWVDRHGVRFERAPMSIAMGAGPAGTDHARGR